MILLMFVFWWIRFDVEGYVTGFGNPEWAETHEPATVTAPAVKLLVEAGAKCVGKLHMDELAYRSFFNHFRSSSMLLVGS